MDSRHVLVLINPVSGSGSGRKAATFLRQNAPTNWQLDELESTHKGHFAAYLQTADLSTYDTLVIMGGDGTMNEVINGLLPRSSPFPPLLLFPCGTGNAFNHDIGCLTWQQALSNLLRQQVRAVDCYQLTCEASEEVIYGFNVAGWGLVSRINTLAERLRFLGKMRYNVATLVYLFKNPRFQATLHLPDSQLQETFSFILFCNNQHTGNAMKMAPMANFSDGLLDILVVSHQPFYKFLALFPKIFSGQHVHSPICKFHRVAEVTLVAQPLVLVVDGELVGQTSFKLKVLPQSVQMIM